MTLRHQLSALADRALSLGLGGAQLGLAMALADRQATGKLVAVDGFELDGKTKSFVQWASDNGLNGQESVLLVTDDANARQGARNLPWVTALSVAGLNVYDILRHERLVIDAVALEPAQEGEQ